MTTHIYYDDCNEEMRLFFDKISEELCPEGYERVKMMDEYYENTMKGSGSDDVFITPHVDGPFKFMNGKLLRCIYAIKGNQRVVTHIKGQNSKSLKDREYVMFDYNRDLHWITNIEGESDIERVVLKLHYVTKGDYMLKYVCIIWNTIARYLFEISKKPKNIVQKFVSFLINKSTKIYANIV